jgi:hypothetical protein
MLIALYTHVEAGLPIFSYISYYQSIYLPIYFLLLPRTYVKRFVSLQFLNLRQSIGLLGRWISQTQGRYLHRQNKQNKRRHLCEPTIPVFEWEKTFHALHLAATVIGYILYSFTLNMSGFNKHIRPCRSSSG